MTCTIVLYYEVMANPAELLHQTLSTWAQSANQTISRNLETSTGWTNQRIAAKNLNDLNELLGNLPEQDTRIYRQYFDTWTKAVYAYPNGWKASSSLTSQSALDMLESAGVYLHTIVPPLQPGAIEDISALRDDATDFITHKMDIPFELQALITESITYLNRALNEYEQTGEFRLNRAIKRFIEVLRLVDRHYSEDRFTTRIKHGLKVWFSVEALIPMITAGIIDAELVSIAPHINNAVEAGTQHLIELALSESITEDQSGSTQTTTDPEPEQNSQP